MLAFLENYTQTMNYTFAGAVNAKANKRSEPAQRCGYGYGGFGGGFGGFGGGFGYGPYGGFGHGGYGGYGGYGLGGGYFPNPFSLGYGYPY